MLAEKTGETAACGVVVGEKVGRDIAVRDGAGQQPFERQAGVEGEELAEADGECLVAHEGGVVERKMVVSHPATYAASAGGNAARAGRRDVVDGAAVERGFEVGQTRSEAQANGQGQGCRGGIGSEFAGRGRAAKGGTLGARFAETLAAAELGEDGASGIGDEERSERREGDARERREREGGAGRMREVSEKAGCILGDVGGFGEGFPEIFHGWEYGVRTREMQGFSYSQKIGEHRDEEEEGRAEEGVNQGEEGGGAARRRRVAGEGELERGSCHQERA